MSFLEPSSNTADKSETSEPAQGNEKQVKPKAEHKYPDLPDEADQVRVFSPLRKLRYD